jgi:hypothetical protein
MAMGINYGLDKVRFPNPVRVDSKVRARRSMMSVELKNPTTIQTKQLVTIEIEDGALRGRPDLDLESPLLVRIADVRHRADGRIEYDLQFIGTDPGVFDLRDVLVFADGTQVDLRLLSNDLELVFLAFIAVIVVRAVVVLVLAPVFRAVDKPIPASWHIVIMWAGLRGSISMALAMGLPVALSYRQDIILMTFGVVILSLFLQGLTMPVLLRKLKVVGASRPVLEYEERLGKVLVHEKALAELRRLKEEMFLADRPYQELEAFHNNALVKAREELAARNEGEEAILEEQMKDARREVQAAQLAALHDAQDRGLLSDEALERLIDYLAEKENEEEEQEVSQEQEGPPS